MNLNRIDAHRLKFFLKVTLSVICYLAFTLYAVPAYHNVRAYVEEKVLTTKKTIIIAESPLVIEVADTEEKRIKGLSGRESLPPDTGMLFIFQEKQKHNFWMKDMNFDIDIVWFNEYGEVVYFVEKASPESYPKLLGPTQESRFVLEVPAGYIREKGLKLGDKIDLY